jgi:hypothetical protein
MPRLGPGGPPANDNGKPPEAMKATDQKPQTTGEDSSGVRLPKPATSPIGGDAAKGAA